MEGPVLTSWKDLEHIVYPEYIEGRGRTPVLSLSKGTYKTELEDGIRLSYEDFLNNPMRAER